MHVRPGGRRPGFLFTSQTFEQREKFRLMVLILPALTQRMLFDYIEYYVSFVFRIILHKNLFKKLFVKLRRCVIRHYY